MGKPRITFDYEELSLVINAVELAISEDHNSIATCPDEDENAAELATIENHKEDLERLLKRLHKTLDTFHGDY